ncbi:calcium-binding protein, partial [Pseudovibrio axinellae]
EIKVRDDGRLEIRGEGTINGGSMNDYIHASSGTDVIDPGSGDGLTNTGQWQNLRGYDGDDVYVIGRDAGKVYINSAGETSGADTVHFEDLTLADLTFENIAVEGQLDALEVRWKNGDDNGFLRLADLGVHIERFEFADGTVLSEISILEDGRLSLKGTDGNDLFIANIGNDSFDGGTGIDVIDYRASSAGVNVDLDAGMASGGSAEGDKLINIESVEGSDFADVITGDEQNNRILGNYGADTLSGGEGHDTLLGGEGIDQLYGNAGIDWLDGGSENDQLFGGTGNDSLYGGRGDDTLEGGADNDTYIYERDDGNDTIADSEGNDTLKFTAGITLSDIHFTREGNDLRLFVNELSAQVPSDLYQIDDQILITDWASEDNRIETLHFNDSGQSYSLGDLIADDFQFV